MNERDLLLVGASLGSTSADRPQVILIRAGRIAYVGPLDQADPEPHKPIVVELGGRRVLPGITDSHTHFHRAAILDQYFIDLEGTDRLDGVLALVRAQAAGKPSGTWIQGDNLNALALSERRLPDRSDLDRVAPSHPVLLRGVGKHVVAANSAALELAGIDRSTEDPPGGRIERDKDGVPTGILHERAKLRLDTSRSDTVVPGLSEDDRLLALEAGFRRLHALGIVALHEIARTPDEVADYAVLRERGRLEVRVIHYIRGYEATTNLDSMLNLGLRSGYGDRWLKVGGVKYSIDGSAMVRNAATYEPYQGEPSNFGLIRMPPGELRDHVARAIDGGLKVAVHAVAGRAVDVALEAFEAAAQTRTLARGHRIEHATLDVTDQQLDRIARLGLTLSAQPVEIWERGDSLIELFGADRANQTFRLRAAADRGIDLLINSDHPCAGLNPFHGLAAAVDRRTRTGAILNEAEALDAEAAFGAMTAGPAKVTGDSWRGGLDVGMAADLIATDRDPLDPSVIARDTRVDLTVIDGRIVHEAL